MGDQRYYFVPCPYCGKMQTLVWENLNYDKDEDGVVSNPRYKCTFCGKLITAGVDVQPDRLEYQIIAWAKDKQNWSIEYEVLEGNPDEPEVWEKLDKVLESEFEHSSGKFLGISVMAIDTGGRNTQSVYQWCLKKRDITYGNKGVAVFGTRNVMPIKGKDLPDIFVPRPNRIEVNGVKNALRLWIIGVSSIKREVYAALKKDFVFCSK